MVADTICGLRHIISVYLNITRIRNLSTYLFLDFDILRICTAYASAHMDFSLNSLCTFLVTGCIQVCIET